MIYHVTPINDIDTHEEATCCKCFPKVEELENGDLMVVHNSFDGREYIEQLVDKDNLHDN